MKKIDWLYMLCFLLSGLLIWLAVSCDTSVTVYENSLSGRYYESKLGIIMILDQRDTKIDASLEQNGKGGIVSGLLDKDFIDHGQVFLDGYLGAYKVHLNLIYDGTDLLGGIIFYNKDWSSGTEGASFRKIQ